MNLLEALKFLELPDYYCAVDRRSGCHGIVRVNHFDACDFTCVDLLRRLACFYLLTDIPEFQLTVGS